MPTYRRYRVPGGTYFFTLVTFRRQRILTDSTARTCLRDAIQHVRAKHPFEIPAFVLLPEHLHAIWTLPRADDDYSTRWKRIKQEFTRSWVAAGGKEAPVTSSRRNRNERGIWQRRFWEHLITDEHDFQRHLDYIHYNAVKHGEAKCAKDWPYSSFSRWVKDGVYDPNWGCAEDGTYNFDDLDETAMEYGLDDESSTP